MGPFCRYGEAVGVATPYNDAISRLVRFLEHKPPDQVSSAISLPGDHPTGDAGPGVAGGITYIIIRPGVNHQGSPSG